MRECMTATVSPKRPEARHRLRRERDLGHEHDGALPGIERALDSLEVDLRLARPGDAVEHDDLAVVRLLRAAIAATALFWLSVRTASCSA